MIFGGALIRQPDAPVRPVLIPLPATLEAERADPSVTSNVSINKRSDSERHVRFSAVRLWKSAGRVKDTERPSSDTPRQGRPTCQPRRNRGVVWSDWLDLIRQPPLTSRGAAGNQAYRNSPMNCASIGILWRPDTIEALWTVRRFGVDEFELAA